MRAEFWIFPTINASEEVAKFLDERASLQELQSIVRPQVWAENPAVEPLETAGRGVAHQDVVTWLYGRFRPPYDKGEDGAEKA